MRIALVLLALAGLGACTSGAGVHTPAPSQDAPVKTGISISGEARVGVTHGI
jgi:hypothetical protein